MTNRYLNQEVQFGKEIRAWRKAKRWSQEELAEELAKLGFKMHQTTVAKLERGKRPIRIAEFIALIEIFSKEVTVYVEQNVK